MTASPDPTLSARLPGGEQPLSFAQQRMWFLQRLDPESVAYNLQANVPLPQDLDLPALERALTELVRRHEILRTRYTSTGGAPFTAPAARSG